MTVEIDEARHDILAGGINNDVTRWALRRAILHGNRIKGHNLRDPVPFDNDVLRPLGGRAVALNDDRPADNEAAGSHTMRGRRLGVKRDAAGETRQHEREHHGGAAHQTHGTTPIRWWRVAWS